MTEAHIQRQKAGLLIADVLAFLIAFAFAMQLRFGEHQLSVFALSTPPWQEMFTALPFMLGAWLFALSLCGVYRVGKKRVFLELARMIEANFIFIGVMLSLTFFYRGFAYSRGFAVLFLGANLLFTFFGRVVFRIVRARIEENEVHRLLLVCNTPVAAHLIDSFDQIVGVLDDRSEVGTEIAR